MLVQIEMVESNTDGKILSARLSREIESVLK